MRFLDTNVFIRYLTGDDPAKGGASRDLFRRLENQEEEMLTSEAVVAEIVYVLTSKSHYGLTRPDTFQRLLPLIQTAGLHLESKARVLTAMDIYAKYPALDFEDALSVAYMESARISEIVSYDRGFDRVAGIVRVEP